MTTWLPFTTHADGVQEVITAAHMNNVQTAITSLAVNAKGYGATGDGATDDTTAVQAAITAANAAGGGVVFFPAGTYLCTKLTLYSLVSLVGAGVELSIIKLKASQNTALLTTNGFVTTDSVAGIYGFSIRDLSFDGNKANQASNTDSGCVQIYGYNYAFSRVKVRNGKTVGLFTNWGSGGSAPGPNGISMEAAWSDVEVYGCGTDGVSWNGPHDSIWNGVVAHENAAKGITIGNRGNSLKALACHSWGTSQTYPWYIDGTSCQLIGCEGEGGSTEQCYVGQNDVIISGGHFFAATGAAKGIEIANSAGGCLIQTKVSNCTTWALLLTADGGNNFDLTVYGASGAVVSGTLSSSSKFRALANGGQTGGVINGPVLLPGVWLQENMSASQTGTFIYMMGAESGAAAARYELPMLRDGSITGIIVRLSANRTAGTATVKAAKNGAAVGLNAVIDGSNTAFKATYATPGTYTFSVGDTVHVLLDTDGSWAPTTDDMTVMVEVSY